MDGAYVFPKFASRLRRNSGTPQPGKLTRARIESGSARWEAAMLLLDHSGGLILAENSCLITQSSSVIAIYARVWFWRFIARAISEYANFHEYYNQGYTRIGCTFSWSFINSNIGLTRACGFTEKSRTTKSCVILSMETAQARVIFVVTISWKNTN